MLELDFVVSVRFSLLTGQLTIIRDAFEGGNEILADATDGQVVIDEICIVTDSQGSRHAEAYILSGSGRANASPDGYGTPGRHINFYYDSNMDYETAHEETGNHYTIAHELSHQVWGVRDEYTGPDTDDADCEVSPGLATGTFCLMDNYFTRGGNSGMGSTYTLNELCSEFGTDHDPDSDTH